MVIFICVNERLTALVQEIFAAVGLTQLFVVSRHDKKYTTPSSITKVIFQSKYKTRVVTCGQNVRKNNYWKCLYTYLYVFISHSFLYHLQICMSFTTDVYDAPV